MTGVRIDNRCFSIEPPNIDGECRKDPDLAPLFFQPEPDDPHDGLTRGQREHEARRVCAGCPVLVTCGLHGLEHEEYGLWGGLSETDRKALGGRHPGHTFGPGQAPRRVVDRMRKAGIGGREITSLLTRWAKRRTEVRDDFEEVA